jgi:hypothetical protein
MPDEPNDMHVVPLNDQREHETYGGSCWCRPVLAEGCEGELWVHNSLNGRELFETGQRLVS